MSWTTPINENLTSGEYLFSTMACLDANRAIKAANDATTAANNAIDAQNAQIDAQNVLRAAQVPPLTPLPHVGGKKDLQPYLTPEQYCIDRWHRKASKSYGGIWSKQAIEFATKKLVTLPEGEQQAILTSIGLATVMSNPVQDRVAILNAMAIGPLTATNETNPAAFDALVSAVFKTPAEIAVLAIPQ